MKDELLKKLEDDLKDEIYGYLVRDKFTEAGLKKARFDTLEIVEMIVKFMNKRDLLNS